MIASHLATSYYIRLGPICVCDFQLAGDPISALSSLLMSTADLPTEKSKLGFLPAVYRDHTSSIVFAQLMFVTFVTYKWTDVLIYSHCVEAEA